MTPICPVLGVAVEIHSAIVGGLITGVVLLAGVLMSEGLIRQRERRSRLEHATHRLTLLVPVVMAYLSEAPPDPQRLSAGSAGWYFEQEMLDSLFEADLLVRSARSRASRQFREALDDLSTRITTATTRALGGRYLTADEVLQISTTDITEALHGQREAAAKKTKR